MFFLFFWADSVTLRFIFFFSMSRELFSGNATKNQPMRLLNTRVFCDPSQLAHGHSHKITLCLESLFIFRKAGNSPYLSHTVIQQNLLWRKGRRTPEGKGKLSGQDRSTWYMWTLFHRDSALACQNQAGDGNGEEKFLASESDLRVEPQSHHGCPLNLSR